MGPDVVSVNSAGEGGEKGDPKCPENQIQVNYSFKCRLSEKPGGNRE